MIKFTPEQIQDNWNELIKLIEDTFEGERKEKLLKMYKHFEDRMCVAPASGQEHFHLCTPGGYVRHILNIVHYSKEFHKLWKENGAIVDDYTVEELVFAAMHHDLGKVGDLNDDHYIPNDSDWHIKITMNEMIGIKLTDGMYDEGNIQYLKAYAPEKKLKTNMPHILHQADMTTTRIEYEDWIRENTKEEIKVQGRVDNIKKAVTMEETSEQLTQKSKDLFDELFGDKS